MDAKDSVEEEVETAVADEVLQGMFYSLSIHMMMIINKSDEVDEEADVAVDAEGVAVGAEEEPKAVPKSSSKLIVTKASSSRVQRKIPWLL